MKTLHITHYNVGATCTKDRPKNELAHILLIGGTHAKQGSEDARVRIVVHLTLNLIKSRTYSGAVFICTSVVNEYGRV